MADSWGPRLRIMTWNVWWRFGPHWRARQRGIVRTLGEVDADVVARQEVWGADSTSQAHEFADRLGTRSWSTRGQPAAAIRRP